MVRLQPYAHSGVHPMSTSANSLMLAELQSAIVRNPLVVTAQTTVIDAIAEMSGVRTTCVADTTKGYTNTVHQEARSSCVLVTEGQTLIGILTERDVVRLSAQKCPLHQTTIGEVVTSPVVTLQVDEFTDLFTAVNLLQQRQIRHLPILDRQNQILGVVTHESLQQLARPVDLLRLRLASEVMSTHVVSAEPDTAMLGVVQLMAEHRVGSVLLVNTQCDADGHVLQSPAGIITERDIVQFQALGLQLDRIAVRTVMSQPVFAVSPDTSLIVVQGIMERYAIRRVVVTGTQGELLGIVTQSTLLQSLNPVELYSLLQVLEQRVTELETEKVKLLENHTAELERQVEQRLEELRIKAEREHLMAKIAAKIAASLHLPDILDTTVQELRSFLGCDRVLIWQFETAGSGVVVAESVGTGWGSALHDTIADPCFQGSLMQHYRDGHTTAIENIHTAGYPDCYVYLLAMYQVKANLVVPIQVADQLWGLLIGHQCSDYRVWQPSDLTLLTEMAVQLAIAIQQANIYQQAQAELAERQRTEAALRESEARFRSFMDYSPTAAWITDADGRLEYINANYCQMLLCPTTVVGQTIFDLYPAEFAQAYIASTQAVTATGQRIETTESGIRPDGNVGEFLVFKFPLPSPDGTPKVGGMAIDITDRSRAADALRQSHQQYIDLVNCIPMGVFKVCTSAEGEDRFEYVSPRWCEINHLDAEAVVQNFSLSLELVHPDDLSNFLQAIDQVRSSQSHFLWEGRFLIDGEVRWMHIEAVVMLQDTGNMIWNGIQYDITDAMQSQQEQERLLAEAIAARTEATSARDLLASVFDRVNDGIVGLDTEGCYTYINRNAAVMLGRPTEALLGCHIWDLFPGAVGKSFYQTYYQAAEQQTPGYIEDYYEPWNRWFESRIYPDAKGLTIYFTDITSRKLAELAARESEQRYASLAEAAPVGIFRTDALGNCLYINDRWSQIVGLSLAEALGIGWVQGLHPQDRDLVSREWYRAAEEVRPFKLEYRFQRPDGSISWVYGQAVAERDAEGQVTGYIGTITDISDRKATEEALSLSSERLNLALNATQIGLWDWSLITHEIIWSPLHEILWGYEPGTPQRTYQDWADRVHPHDVSRIEKTIQAARIQQEDFKAEYRIIWPDGSLHWISAMGRFIFEHNQPIRMIGLVFDVSDRKATEEALQIQRDFNQLIAEITSRFVDLHPEDLDIEIDRTLQLIGEMTRVETSYLFQYNESTCVASMTHEWCQPGCFRQMPLAQSIPSWDLFPWSTAKLMQRQVIHVPNVANLPNEAALDQANWQQHNLTSILMIPLVQASAVTGAIGFASFSQAIDWDDETIRLLQVMGQTIANAQERTHAEQQLYESAERLRLALAAANQGLYDLNLQTGEAVVSPEYATMLGYDPATFQETNAAWIERLHPDDQASIKALYHAYIAGNLPQYQVEFRQRTQAGDYKWILALGKIVAWDDAGNPLRMLGTHTDISDRKQAEAERFETEKLRLELSLLESILDIILAGYWDWDIPNHHEYLSPGLKRMLGYEDDELPNLPETWQTLIFAEDLPGVLDCLRRHIQSHGAVPYYNEVRYHHKAGSTVWVICSGQVIDWDANGNPLRMIGCHVDITTRKQSEDALRLSEERLQLALEAAGDGLWDWNVTTGDLYLSPQWLTMLGFRPGELPAHVSVWESLVHPDDRSGTMERLYAHFQDASIPYRFDYRVQTKTGGYRWIANYGKVVVRDGQGRPQRMIGTHRDVTASKQVEEQLRKSDAHLKAAQRIGKLGSWEFDLRTEQITWSDEVYRIFGRDLNAGPPSFEELQQYVHPNDRGSHQLTIQTAIETQQTYEIEFRICRHDGTLRHLQARGEPIADATGHLIQLVGTVLDISDRKQAEQELRNLSGRLTLAVRSAAMGIWDWNVTENILTWDDRMYELYGLNPTQFTGVYDAWANVLHPDDRFMVERAIQQALAGEQDYEPEFRVVHPDGTIRFIKAYALVQRNDQGSPQRMIGINFDISDRKQAESQLLQTTAQLAASNRELEAFAYSVSHDLRSPLRAIDGFSKALLEDYGDQIGVEGQDYFDRIRRNVNRMGTLIDDLLRLSRVSRSEMRYDAVNLSALVQEQINELQISEPERQVTCVITPDIIVAADAALMRIVISNLIQNAWKFTSHHATAQIEFGVMQIEGQPTYFVRDDGAGFDMAYTKMLFGVFQRLHNTHEFPGTGIGLATVQRVIHRHGGQVWAQGAIEQGTTVYFTLPKTPSFRRDP